MFAMRGFVARDPAGGAASDGGAAMKAIDDSHHTPLLLAAELGLDRVAKCVGSLRIVCCSFDAGSAR